MVECAADVCQWALFKITKVEYVEVPAKTKAPSVVQTVAAQTYKYLQNRYVYQTQYYIRHTFRTKDNRGNPDCKERTRILQSICSTSLNMDMLIMKSKDETRHYIASIEMYKS